MRAEPVVSIGMPVYKAERHLGRALDSLLAQEFNEFEIFISDNASSDSTADICRQYAAKDSRVTYEKRDRNYGQLANFDFTAKGARSKYFMWAAVDDYWEPGFIKCLVQELEAHPESGLAMCSIRRVREDGATVDYVRYQGTDDPNRMGHLKMLMALATGFANKKRYHLYFYGL